GDDAVKLPDRPVCVDAADARVHQVRVEPEGGVEVGDGPGEVALAVAGDPPVMVGEGRGRSGGKRGRGVGDGQVVRLATGAAGAAAEQPNDHETDDSARGRLGGLGVLPFPEDGHRVYEEDGAYEKAGTDAGDHHGPDDLPERLAGSVGRGAEVRRRRR